MRKKKVKEKVTEIVDGVLYRDSKTLLRLVFTDRYSARKSLVERSEKLVEEILAVFEDVSDCRIKRLLIESALRLTELNGQLSLLNEQHREYPFQTERINFETGECRISSDSR